MSNWAVAPPSVRGGGALSGARPMSRTVPGWVLVGVCVITFGCGTGGPTGGPLPDEKKLALEEVGSLLQTRAQDGKQPPRKVDDLKPYENAFPTGFAAVRSGEVVVDWRANAAG